MERRGRENADEIPAHRRAYTLARTVYSHDTITGVLRVCRGLGKGNKQLTKKAEPPPTRDVDCNRSGNGGWLRQLVRRLFHV